MTLKSKRFANQQGITLVEVIVVMLISVMLIMVAALGIGTFFRKYRELTSWIELQKDAINCINTMKNGVPVGSGTSMEYYGVANALKLQLTNTTTNTGNGLRITPPTAQGEETPDYAHFYLYNNCVRCTYVHHGIQVASPLYIFPTENNRDRMTVEKYQITKVNQEQEVLALQVELFAKVWITEDSYRQVRFRTKMVKK
jgi:type II secretory pathway pseudopilin PulG